MSCRLNYKALTLVVAICSCLAYANQEVSTPTALRAIPPAFPIPKDGKNAMGEVVVEVQIDSDGKVLKAQTVTGHPALRGTSEKAAKRWVFSAIKDQPKVRSIRLTFMFRLMDEETVEEELVTIFEPPFRVEVRRVMKTIHVRST